MLTVGNGLLAYADILAHGGSPSDAVAAAMEASRIGEAFGAGWFAAVGRRSMADALAAMTVSGTGDRTTAGREVHRVITESRDSHSTSTAFWVLDSLAALLWEYDAPTAYLLRLATRRMWATGAPLPADAVDVLGPATVAELEARGNAMSADEIVVLALDALERYLGAVDLR